MSRRLLVLALGVVIAGGVAGCERPPSSPVETTTASPATEDGPGGIAAVDLDLSGVEVPDGPVGGQVAGRRFELSDVEFHAHSGAIVLRSAAGQVVFIFVPGLDLEAIPAGGFSLDVIRPRSGPDQPHVHLHYPDPDTGSTLRQSLFTEGFTLRLRVTRRHDGGPAVGLVLRLPTDPVSSIAGNAG